MFMEGFSVVRFVRKDMPRASTVPPMLISSGSAAVTPLCPLPSCCHHRGPRYSHTRLCCRHLPPPLIPLPLHLLPSPLPPLPPPPSASAALCRRHFRLCYHHRRLPNSTSAAITSLRRCCHRLCLRCRHPSCAAATAASASVAITSAAVTSLRLRCCLCLRYRRLFYRQLRLWLRLRHFGRAQAHGASLSVHIIDPQLLPPPLPLRLSPPLTSASTSAGRHSLRSCRRSLYLRCRHLPAPPVPPPLLPSSPPMTPSPSLWQGASSWRKLKPSDN
ncbi:hypothetical protein BGX38DRAFT_260773 [Terfezia claveryi]|nr:hypothetical protein BGX38DRAFT_260773 [Terfezia claveryi]